MNRLLVASATVASMLLAAGAARADDVRVIVKFKGQASRATVEDAGGRVLWTADGTAVISMPAKAVAKLRAHADVAYVEEDSIFEATAPGDAAAAARPGGGGTAPSQTTPWGVSKIEAGDAWAANAATSRGEGVKVAVIDTGIDLDHPDLAANVVATSGYDFANRDAKPDDDNGHGSHVAGIIAAVDNTIGYVGVAPKASLYAVKVLDRRGSGYLSDVAAGIDWAVAHGMHVANLSLGGSSGATTLETACANAVGKTLLVAAAGNSGDGSTATTERSYPAAYAACVAVGATDAGDLLAKFSNSGSFVDVAAPGVSVPSTYKGGSYATLSGTSMASPHAAGMAALLFGAGSTASSVRADLEAKVRDLGPTGYDNGFGHGRIEWTPP